ncbi:unnamed protein product, partial [marine sediment metagenome]
DKFKWNIVPASYGYSNITSNQVNQDFLAEYVGITVKQDGSEDFTTIQQAINASVSGDDVIVHAGRYYENIYFNGKNIVLRSTNPQDPNVVAATVIDANGSGTVVTFSGSETFVCKLEGFIITGGSASDGGGIYGNSTRAVIIDCIIIGNSARNATISRGGGLYNFDGTIRNCTITGNSAGSYGGGLSNCDGTIQNCTIANNSASGGGGGLDRCHGVIQSCTITGNSASSGGGLYICDETILNCIISNNTAHSGGGL